ncbi:MAG: hypothetical protein GC147_10905 [Porphyrobacter sp.]|nr:hypothetical protein [Porphyrobacter sp.]
MIQPNPSSYEPLDGINFAIAAMNGALREHLPVLASSVQRAGRPMLIVTFVDANMPVCTGMTLFRPVPAGVEIGRVEPCLLEDGGALILVAADRSKAFGIDGKGELVERPVPRLARNGNGIDRAWADLERRMFELVKDTGCFPLGSWELHLEPLG